MSLSHPQGREKYSLLEEMPSLMAKGVTKGRCEELG